MTTHLKTLRSDILTATRGYFPTDVVRQVKQHDGPFGLSEVMRYSTAAPAIILAIEGGKSEQRGGSINATLVMSAYVLTKGKTDEQRTDGALLIVERFLKLLHYVASWNTQECVKRPEGVHFRNLYAEALDKKGLALWAIGWEQLIQIPGIEDAATLDDFTTLYATNTNARPTEDPTDTAASEQHISLPIEE